MHDVSSLPIDIHAQKLLDWLVSRRHVKDDWQKDVAVIRKRITAALMDMPEHPDITALLSGSYLNYFHCKKIVEILRETERDSKNVFGYYSSQRMKDWQEIIKLYEADGVYLAEASQLLFRNVVYEIPGIRRQITKFDNDMEEFEKRAADALKNAEGMRNKFQQSCKQMNVIGDDLKRELIALLNELPTEYEKITKEIAGIENICKFYQSSVAFALGSRNVPECVPLLWFIAKHGNVTTYEWRYGEPPLKIEAPPETDWELNDVVQRKDSTDSDDFEKIDFGEAEGGTGDFVDIGNATGEIDWGDHTETTISWGPAGQECLEGSLEDAGITVESSGVEGGTATDEDALTLLDNMRTRNIIVDDLCELEAFLRRRMHELSDDSSNEHGQVLALSLFQHAPADVQMQTLESLQKMLSEVTGIIGMFTNVRIQHLFLIKSSPRYVDRLAQSVREKLDIAKKLEANSEGLLLKKTKAFEDRGKLVPALKTLISKTLNLQHEIEDEISKKYKNRPVNIMAADDKMDELIASKRVTIGPVEDHSELDRLFKCQICKTTEFTREPWLIPCMHTVCNNCFDDLPQGKQPCMHCRLPFKKEQAVRHALAVQYFSEKKGHVVPRGPCSNCPDADSAYYCRTCVLSFCPACYMTHQRVRAKLGHVVDRVHPQKTLGVCFCCVHTSKPAEKLCRTCRVFLCDECSRAHIRSHSLVLVDKMKGSDGDDRMESMIAELETLEKKLLNELHMLDTSTKAYDRGLSVARLGVKEALIEFATKIRTSSLLLLRSISDNVLLQRQRATEEMEGIKIQLEKVGTAKKLAAHLCAAAAVESNVSLDNAVIQTMKKCVEGADKSLHEDYKNCVKVYFEKGDIDSLVKDAINGLGEFVSEKVPPTSLFTPSENGLTGKSASPRIGLPIASPEVDTLLAFKVMKVNRPVNKKSPKSSSSSSEPSVSPSPTQVLSIIPRPGPSSAWISGSNAPSSVTYAGRKRKMDQPDSPDDIIVLEPKDDGGGKKLCVLCGTGSLNAEVVNCRDCCKTYHVGCALPILKNKNKNSDHTFWKCLKCVTPPEHHVISNAIFEYFRDEVCRRERKIYPRPNKSGRSNPGLTTTQITAFRIILDVLNREENLNYHVFYRDASLVMERWDYDAPVVRQQGLDWFASRYNRSLPAFFKSSEQMTTRHFVNPS
ncbi:unnamed protein product [Notodromas monacha]|uniref:Uncharacterized protein n=1 Tax=Notodromas monacha TaxID=399045 RepID=A0A7R9GDP2_9CRUS|nr:unnamed protein product [Notodromas monacha]CAG0918744.1 unnamed protein product [Notodromas monacha]